MTELASENRTGGRPWFDTANERNGRREKTAKNHLVLPWAKGAGKPLNFFESESASLMHKLILECSTPLEAEAVLSLHINFDPMSGGVSECMNFVLFPTFSLNPFSPDQMFAGPMRRMPYQFYEFAKVWGKSPEKQNKNEVYKTHKRAYYETKGE
ncbi:hypothetical protein AVEN_222001-1 [Araneus ventricosus]|uniref:Uncharacterized protein n=1 Tax=Araneus ventricosus TaxID=182803 RepID=A0A4Y2GK03_ARAVE|nr:hypothetical protein AVEN_222001-1 [Araneus ventricosus]